MPSAHPVNMNFPGAPIWEEIALTRQDFVVYIPQRLAALAFGKSVEISFFNFVGRLAHIWGY